MTPARTAPDGLASLAAGAIYAATPSADQAHAIQDISSGPAPQG